MSKGLDALEKIKQAEYFVDFELDVKIKDDYKTELAIIEQELKEYERLKEDIKKCSCWKEHKALEIIKKLFDKPLLPYEDLHISDQEKITQEEYDLLKEVLLCH